MKKYLKVICIVCFMIFSFYYTEKIALYVQNNTPLKKEIITYKESNKVLSVNAIVDGEYIIPGINGLEVNVEKSYNKMKTYSIFNVSDIVYDEIKPNISIKDYPNKIIIKGNEKKNAVSIIISNDSEIINSLKEKNIDYDLVDNKYYCIITYTNKCDNKPMVKPSIILNNNTFLKNISNIKKGDIIFIENKLLNKYEDVLIKYLKYNNIKILKLKNHLSESPDEYLQND